MQNKTRKSMIAVLSCCLMATSAFMINTLSRKTADADTTLTAENCDYNVAKGASMRISNDANGTGLRFRAEIPADQYTTLKSNGTVRFGILVAPQADHKEAPLSEATVFTQSTKVYKDISKPEDTGTYQVKILETETLTLDTSNTEQTSDDVYFTYASMVGIQPKNVTRQFVAKAYVEVEDAYGITTRYFKDGDTGAYSISYLAQDAIENQSDKIVDVMGEGAIEKIQQDYITGQKGTVTVEVVKNYGETPITSEVTLEIALGTTLDNNTVFTAMGFETEVYALNASSNINGKVYSDNRTAKVTLKVDALEVADYSAVDGYFANANNAVTLGVDKSALVQTINGMEEGTYKVYADGTVMVSVGQNNYWGANADGSLTLKMADENQVLLKTVELGNVAYENIAGKYLYNGKEMILNANGTLVYDGETAGYALAYNEVDGNMYLIAGTQTSILEEVSYDNGKYIISDMSLYNLASKTDYDALASEYVVSGGAYDKKLLRFAVDGKILQATDTTGAYTEKGLFKLFNDGTISVTLDDKAYTGTFAQVTSETAIDKTISLTGTDDTLTLTAKKLTANIYDILGSAEGKKYYHETSNHEKYYVQLFNTKGVNANNDGTYYQAVWKMDTAVNRVFTNDGTERISYKIFEKADDFGIILFNEWSVNWADSVTSPTATNCCFYYIVNGIVILDVNKYGPESATSGNYPNYKYSEAIYANKDYAYALEGRVAELKSGLVRENAGVEAEEVVVEKSIYEEIAGAYVQAKSYTGGPFITSWGGDPVITLSEKDGGHNFHFSLDDVNSAYTLEPITDNFGEIIVNAGRYHGHHAGFYAKVGNEYVLRISDYYGGVNFGKFVDYVKEGSTFSSWDVFDALAGNAKEANTATSISYTDVKGNSLVLNNPGNMNYQNYATYTFTSGTTSITGSYDIIATSATTGKILMYNPKGDANGWNKDVVYGSSLYAFADYELVNGNYIISVNNAEFLGGKYVFGAGDMPGNIVAGKLVGSYVGFNGETLTVETATVEVSSIHEGFVTIGETKYAYEFDGDRVVLVAGNAIFVKK